MTGAFWPTLATLPPVVHASYAMCILTVLLLLPTLLFIIAAKRGRELYIRRIPGIDATEEAILNSLFRAERMVGRDGHTREALPLEKIEEALKKAIG